MKLLVVRHAIAMERDDFQKLARERSRTSSTDIEFESNDEHRPLTEDGAKKMRKNAKGLADLIKAPDLLASSPLTRAVQTAEILQANWEESTGAICEVLKPGSAPSDFLEWLQGRHETKREDALIAIVGHEPHLSSLVSWLLTGSSRPIFEFKKGGACLLEFKTSIDKGRAKMLWLAPPTQLRKIK